MTTTKVALKEEDLIKVMLEFLSSRNYFVAMRTLEKESGVINCEYSGDLLCLRELVLDGDWDEVLAFVEPFQSNVEFDSKRFRYHVLRQRFIEFLSMKSHVLDKSNNSGSVAEVIRTLHSLEEHCSSKEEYSNLCWLLTVPNLKDRPEFKGWTIDNSRMECFHNILDVVSAVIPSNVRTDPNRAVSRNGRLLQLITQGVLYESCTAYCRSAAMGKPIDNSRNLNINLAFGPEDNFSANLLSWIRTFRVEDFVRPFEDLPVDVVLESSNRSAGLTQSLDEPHLFNHVKDLKPVSQSLVNLGADVTKSHVNSRTMEQRAKSRSKISKTRDKLPEKENMMPPKRQIRSSVSPVSKLRQTATQIAADSPMHDNSAGEINQDKTQHAINSDKRMETNGKTVNIAEESSEFRSIREIKDAQRMDVANVLRQHDERRRLMEHELQGNTPHSDHSEIDAVTGRRGNGIEAMPSTVPQYRGIDRPSRSSTDDTFLSLRSSGPAAADPGARPIVKARPNHHERPKEVTPSAIYKERVVATRPEHVDPPPTLSTSTPKSERHRSNHSASTRPSPAALSMDRPITDKQGDQQMDEKVSLSLSKNKENNAQDEAAALGPKINGVRIPLAKAIIPNAQQDNVEIPVEHVTSKPRDVPDVAPLDGHIIDHADYNAPVTMASKSPPTNRLSGPKIKTKDGSKVLVSDLLKSREEIKNASATPTRHSSPHHRSNRHGTRHQFKPLTRLTDVQAIRAVSFHPGGEMVAIGSNSKTLRLCAVDFHSSSHNESYLPDMEVLYQRGKYHRGSIYCCAWTPRGDLLATGSNDKVIKLLPYDSINSVPNSDEAELNIHNGTVRELAFVPGKPALLVSGGAGDGSVPVTDCQTSQGVGSLRGHSGNVMTVFAGEGDLVATGSSDNTVRLWDLRSRRCIDVVMLGESSPAAVALNGHGTLLAAGQEDGCMLLYDLTAGRTLHSFRVHQEDCRSVRFSPDSRLLLTGSYDTAVNLLHCDGNLEASPPLQYTVGHHDDKVIQCRWHPTQPAFITTSADKTAVLWGAANPQP